MRPPSPCHLRCEGIHLQKHSLAIRVLVVDDEPLARSNLCVLLRADPDVSEIGECGSGEEAIRTIRSTRPDLVFLDVQMPECDGFDVLEMLGTETPPALIFVTAYDSYALRAFEAGALDYILKPFDNPRFRNALDRAKQRLAHASAKAPHRIVIKTAGHILFLRPGEIDWIEAADYYASLHVGSRTHLLRRSLTDLEQELDPAAFCRVHRSAIVNLERVRGLEYNQNGDYEVVLDDDTRLPLSRRYRKEFQSRLGLRNSSS